MLAISQEAVEGVITCVQDFVGDASFNRRSFFSDSGLAMLQDAVAPGLMSGNQFEVVIPVTSPRESYVDDPSFAAAFNRETYESR